MPSGRTAVSVLIWRVGRRGALADDHRQRDEFTLTVPHPSAASTPAPSSRSGGWRRGPGRSSPWKYSWNSTRSRQCGSFAKRSSSPWHGRRPFASGRKRRARRRASSRATSREVHHAAPSRSGHSTLSVVAVEVVVALERLDQQIVHREPDRPAPVGVAAEHAGRRLAGHVVDAVLLAVDARTRTAAPRERATASGCRAARGTRSRRAGSAARAPAARATGWRAAGGASRAAVRRSM